MIEYRKLRHEDYDDILDICKDIWDGNDYLPQVFHKWVDDKGLFLGAVDSDRNKVIGTDKYSLLYDGTGWLEGLRIHKDYRGRGIGKELALRMFNEALKDLSEGRIKKIAFSADASSVESIGIMKQLGFKLEQGYLLISKPYSNLNGDLSVKDFSVQSWKPSYEEFAELHYIKRRRGILPFAFCFQEPTPELHEDFIKKNCFVSINNHKGLFMLKGEPHFIVFDESFEGINSYMDYYLLLLKGKCPSTPLTSVMQEDTDLIASLKAAGFVSWGTEPCNYLYFTYKL